MNLRAYWDGAHGRIVRYVISGGTAAFVNLGLLYSLTEFLHLWYVLSSIIAVCIAWVVSFVLQKFWAFRDHGMETVHVQFVMHAILSLTNIVLNAMVLYALVEWVHLWYMAAQVVIGVMLAFMNYAVNKRYIFRTTSEDVSGALSS